MSVLIAKAKRCVRTLKVFKPLYKCYSWILERPIRKCLQENGNGVIRYIQNALSDKFFFFFDMGTLLGIVREGMILKHDYDIDVAVYIKDRGEIDKVRAAVVSGECALMRSFYIDEVGVVEDSFLMNNIRFDICYYELVDNKHVCYLFRTDPYKLVNDGLRLVFRLKCEPIVHTEKIKFSNFFVNVPEDPEDYLRERYGDSWRMPDKNFCFWNGPTAEMTDLIGKCKVY